MLILTRKSGQVVIIDLVEGVDPRTPAGELFAQGPIAVMVTGIRPSQTRLYGRPTFSHAARGTLRRLAVFRQNPRHTLTHTPIESHGS